MMASVRLLKILAPAMFITFLTAAAVFLYHYPLISLLQENSTVYTIPEIAGKAFILTGILPLILNWNWVKSQIFGIKPAEKKKKK